jgi:small ligand-binding sensory domain FIST
VSLDDRPAAEMLADVLSEEGPAGRTGASRLALVGLGPPGARDEPPAAGHWLIRNVLGIERGKGALAIGAALREGQWIRFHVRDPDAARADLQRALQDRPAGVHQAALLHACLGRGRALHGDPDVEVGIVQRALGPLATAGLFCGGEIGPVGGATWLHAYTQSVALLRA